MKRYIKSSRAPKCSVKEVFQDVRRYYDEDDISLLYYDDDMILFTVNGEKLSFNDYSDRDEAELSFELTEMIEDVLENQSH